MKIKTALFILFSVVLVLTLSFLYYSYNYKTLEEAIHSANIEYEQIYHTTQYKDYTIIFYGKDDILSAGLLEKTFFGYKWGYGFGAKMFNEESQILTRAFSNLSPQDSELDVELVSLTFGVINDPEINQLKIFYKDQMVYYATIINTDKGPIWYCFSAEPVNYDPGIIRIYNNGREVSGWY